MLDAYRENYVEKVRSTERLATIGQLAATIGHELRNPLGIAESSLFLIGQRLKAIGVEDETVSKHQERIVGQLKRCGQTISNLLDLARNRPPGRARVGLRPLIAHALEQSRVETPVVVAVDDALQIEVDPDDFVHVIVNLLVNANDAQGGTGSVRITACQSNGGVEIVVTDEGPGIPAEIGGRVFDALFTTKPHGTGLGLALCRRILEAHGGEIRLQPSERGACFRLWIPGPEHPREIV
jgi:signal transduction histidine kinase